MQGACGFRPQGMKVGWVPGGGWGMASMRAMSKVTAGSPHADAVA